jgi:PAS domain-containing protein
MRLRKINLKQRLQIEIAKRQQVEKTLAKTQARLKEVLRLANIGFWERDFVSDQITWSEEVDHILGRPRQKHPIREADLEKLIHPDDLPIHRQAHSGVLHERRPRNGC